MAFLCPWLVRTREVHLERPRARQCGAALQMRCKLAKVSGMAKHLISTMAAMVCALLVVTARADDLQAEVMKLTGKADFKVGEKAGWQQLREKMKLTATTVIRTGEGANVTLAVGSRGLVTIHELSTVTLTTMKERGARGAVSVQGAGGSTGVGTGKEETQIDLFLQQGKLWNKLKKKDSSEKTGMTIHTPAAVASVRGTSFFMSFEPDTKAATIGVWEGSVAVTSATLKNELQTVNPGHRIVVRYNEPLTAPEKMPTDELQRQQQFEETLKGLDKAGHSPARPGMPAAGTTTPPPLEAAPVKRK